VEITTTTFDLEYRIFRLLGRGSDPTMLRLVCLMAEVGGVSPSDFSERVGMTVSSLAFYFKTLREMELVRAEKTGVINGRIYYLDGPGAAVLREKIRTTCQTQPVRDDVAWFRAKQAAGELMADPDKHLTNLP
jgi:DNA-binding transcriptional ArsR family regulator